MAGLSFAALAEGISADLKSAETLAGERSLVVTPSNESSDSHPGQILTLSYLRKLLSVPERLGCLSLRSALASICRIRSRVTEFCWPNSSTCYEIAA
jgi:hypothetical protein